MICIRRFAQAAFMVFYVINGCRPPLPKSRSFLGNAANDKGKKPVIYRQYLFDIDCFIVDCVIFITKE